MTDDHAERPRLQSFSRCQAATWLSSVLLFRSKKEPGFVRRVQTGEADRRVGSENVARVQLDECVDSVVVVADLARR